MTVHIEQVQPLINENSSITATARFRSGGAASVPATNVKWRLDNLSTTKTLQDWASITPASEVSISITSAMNAIQSNVNNTETIQLTVASNRGETDAEYGSIIYKVQNIFGYKANT